MLLEQTDSTLPCKNTFRQNVEKQNKNINIFVLKMLTYEAFMRVAECDLSIDKSIQKST